MSNSTCEVLRGCLGSTWGVLILLSCFLILFIHLYCVGFEIRSLESDSHKAPIRTPCRYFHTLRFTGTYNASCSTVSIFQISHTKKSFSHFQVVRIWLVRFLDVFGSYLWWACTRTCYLDAVIIDGKTDGQIIFSLHEPFDRTSLY